MALAYPRAPIHVLEDLGITTHEAELNTACVVQQRRIGAENGRKQVLHDGVHRVVKALLKGKCEESICRAVAEHEIDRRYARLEVLNVARSADEPGIILLPRPEFVPVLRVLVQQIV